MVQECRNRPNGMSVDEWCQANNITKANYYYRFAQVRKACLDSIPSNAVKHAIIPGSYGTDAYGTRVDSSCSNSALIQDSFLDISANGVTIRVAGRPPALFLKKCWRYLPMLNDATCFKQVYIVCGYTDYLRSIIIREDC